jgi:hypothetical protein
MPGRRPPLVVTIALAAAMAPGAAAPQADPFAFFAPTIRLSGGDRQRLDHGQAIVRTIPGRDREVAVFAVARTSIDADRLVAWVHRIDALKKSALVPIIQRFSTPPAPGDLALMKLPDDDLRDLRRCRSGSCDVKLTDPEIASLRQHLSANGASTQAASLQDWFRAAVLERVRRYWTGGHPAIGAWADGSDSRPLADDFAALLTRSTYITGRMPELAAYLRGAPAAVPAGIQTFLYWSQDQVRGSPVMTATHVAIGTGRGPADPLVLVAGKQIFATHYMNGSLSVTALVGGRGGPTYLVYINRTDVDVVSGLFGGLARAIIEGRIRSEANTAITDLRKRLESGPPK